MQASAIPLKFLVLIALVASAMGCKDASKEKAKPAQSSPEAQRQGKLIPDTPPEGTLEVRVGLAYDITGMYDTRWAGLDATLRGRIVVPAGEPVVLTWYVGQISEFWMPAVGLETTLVRPNEDKRQITLQFDEPGEATLYGRHDFCPDGTLSEACRIEARATIEIKSSTEFKTWFAGGGPLSDLKNDAAKGEYIVNHLAGCHQCHTAQGDRPAIGPPITGQWGTSVQLDNGETRIFDEAYVRESIEHPSAYRRKGYTAPMPIFAGRFTDETFKYVFAYLKGSKSVQ